MLLPMLVIYQEYVRNHHFSLQVLAECKQKEVFSKMLKRLEEKPALQGRTLETFLTYPMHQVCISCQSLLFTVMGIDVLLLVDGLCHSLCLCSHL